MVLVASAVTIGVVPVASALQFSDLLGWDADGHGKALGAFRRSCGAMGRKAEPRLRDICAAAQRLPESISDGEARRFFESNFEPVPVIDGGRESGLFTGYFEPELAASPVRTAGYAVPLRASPRGLETLGGKRRPAGLAKDMTHAVRRGNALVALPDRRQIEAGALDRDAPPIAWLRSPVDAFFLHVQGSGRLRYPDGSVGRVGYAGKNGYPYTSIGRVLVDRGVMALEDVSMQSLRAWLEADDARGRELMAQNRSYIFFRDTGAGDPRLGPVGQQGVPLTPGRSLAVDLAHHKPGSLLWLETLVPGPGGEGRELFSRLMVAQDTGSAIKGRIRGDIFFGSGDEAGARAGRMQSEGRFVALVPRR